MLASDDTPQLLKGCAQRWIGIKRAYRRDPGQKDPVFFGAPVAVLLAGDHAVDAGLAASKMGNPDRKPEVSK